VGEGGVDQVLVFVELVFEFSQFGAQFLTCFLLLSQEIIAVLFQLGADLVAQVSGGGGQAMAKSFLLFEERVASFIGRGDEVLNLVGKS
jgi:hypothetical protein